MTKLELFSSGYCTGNRKHIHKGEHNEKLNFHATWALIKHVKLGNIVFDTGYTNRFYDVTKKFPFKLYKWATPVYHDDKQSCKNILQSKGIAINDIDHVIISHFHADHIGGIKDFPNSTKWFSKDAWEHFQSKTNWSGVVSAYLKPLVPNNLIAKYPNQILSEIKWNNFKAWQWEEDILFIDLPGHSRGQIGLFIKNTNFGDVFLLADASWTQDAIKNKKYPSKIVKIFVDNYQKLTETIDKLHDFKEKYPDTLMIPTHCSEIAKQCFLNLKYL